MGNARVLWLKNAFVMVVAMGLVGCAAPGGAQAASGSIGSPYEPYLVYQADWSSGIGGWTGETGWKMLNGMLLNDGTTGSPIFADFEPGARADHAVEADISLIRGEQNFGIVVRVGMEGGGYGAGIYRGRARIAHYGTGGIVAGEAFDPGVDFHTYRVEAKGNVITFSVDGVVLGEMKDNKYLEGGQVGLWSHGLQLEVRSFQVFAI
ncbi:MAG: hypothetical protein ACRD0K_28625 [Egibacteraceae bacterium]